MTTSPPPPPTGPTPAEPTVGSLVNDLTQQVPELIRSELRLAQAEMTQKGKQAGIGIGMFSAAGLLAFFGLAVLISAAVAALALVLPVWASALIVAAVLLAAAGGVALVGKNKVTAATPPKPERALDNVRQDVEAVKGGGRG